ncbi:MAG: hypothetical protein OXH69_10065 [Acidobacteria bacterium]|nr:hypothetical protein [Acidobacteriota bacterium]
MAHRQFLSVAVILLGVAAALSAGCGASRALGLPEWGESDRLCEASHLVQAGMTVAEAGQVADGILDNIGWEDALVSRTEAGSTYQFKVDDTVGLPDGPDRRPMALMTIRVSDGTITDVRASNMCG